VTSTTTPDVDTVAINTIRALCMDEIQHANSGHPGTPIGAAPLAYTLWQRFLRFAPRGGPIWPNRDHDEVLPPSVKARVAVEQASTLGWERYIGDGDAVNGMHTFGASAPLKKLVDEFGFTPGKVAERARECLAAARRQQPR
jgi:transketolase